MRPSARVVALVLLLVAGTMGTVMDYAVSSISRATCTFSAGGYQYYGLNTDPPYIVVFDLDTPTNYTYFNASGANGYGNITSCVYNTQSGMAYFSTIDSYIFEVVIGAGGAISMGAHFRLLTSQNLNNFKSLGNLFIADNGNSMYFTYTQNNDDVKERSFNPQGPTNIDDNGPNPSGSLTQEGQVHVSLGSTSGTRMIYITLPPPSPPTSPSISVEDQRELINSLSTNKVYQVKAAAYRNTGPNPMAWIASSDRLGNITQVKRSTAGSADPQQWTYTTLPLEEDEGFVFAATFDAANDMAYFGMNLTTGGYVLKVNVTSDPPTRVGVAYLPHYNPTIMSVDSTTGDVLVVSSSQDSIVKVTFNATFYYNVTEALAANMPLVIDPPPAPPAQPPPDPIVEGSNTGLIVGLVILGIILSILVALGVVSYVKKRNAAPQPGMRQSRPYTKEDEEDERYYGVQDGGEGGGMSQSSSMRNLTTPVATNLGSQRAGGSTYNRSSTPNTPTAASRPQSNNNPFERRENKADSGVSYSEDRYTSNNPEDQPPASEDTGPKMTCEEFWANGIPSIADDNFQALPLLTSCCEYLMQPKSINQEGIFRIPAGQDVVKALLKRFQNGENIDLESEIHDPHEVAGLLKLYLKTLPQPPLPRNLYTAMTQANKIDSDDPGKVECMKAVLNAIPPARLHMLHCLIFVFGAITDNWRGNKMKVANMSICMGPTLLRDMGIGVGNDILSYWIIHRAELFQ